VRNAEPPRQRPTASAADAIWVSISTFLFLQLDGGCHNYFKHRHATFSTISATSPRCCQLSSIPPFFTLTCITGDNGKLFRLSFFA
jgi:hypothetical protein